MHVVDAGLKDLREDKMNNDLITFLEDLNERCGLHTYMKFRPPNYL